MAYDNEKLQRFEQSVLMEAEKKIQEIQAETEKMKENELENTRQKEYDKMFSVMQEQVHQLQLKYRQEVTKVELDGKRELLEFRNQLTEKIFQEAEEKLQKFTDTKEYQSFLLTSIQTAAESFTGQPMIISIQEKDLPLTEKICELVPTATAQADPANQLGGFKLIQPEKNVLQDETFANDLDKQRQEFYRTCGLTIAV